MWRTYLRPGIVTETVSQAHDINDFIAFMKKLDSSYPQNKMERVISDNMNVDTSEKTRKFLLIVPNEFEFVFSPKHGS